MARRYPAFAPLAGNALHARLGWGLRHAARADATEPGSRLERALLATLLSATLTLAIAVGAAAQAASTQSGTIAITNVTVVPMTQEGVLPARTVVVRDGRIASIAAGGAAPADALVIDGTGKFLMPGLIDMHIHAVGGTGERGDGIWQQMTLLVANGVTTARSLAGSATAPQVRERIRAGQLTGPTLYLAGASFNTNSMPTADAARAAVAQQKQAGLDYIKTHGVSSEVYDAMVAAAKQHGLPVVGHVTPAYGLGRALEAGQQIEHLDGYLAALLPAGAAQPTGQFFFGPELDAMSEARVRMLARETVEAGIWNSPTMALFEIVALGRGAAPYAAWPETKYAPKNALNAWTQQLDGMAQQPVPAQRRQRYLHLRNTMLRGLHDAGAPLLVGSDSPQLFLLPGFALHRELAALVRAGLTPYDALAAATSNAGRYLDAEVGIVAEGGVADLLLVDANPLDDIANASRISGIVLGGRWLPKSEIDAMLAEVERMVAG